MEQHQVLMESSAKDYLYNHHYDSKNPKDHRKKTTTTTTGGSNDNASRGVGFGTSLSSRLLGRQQQQRSNRYAVSYDRNSSYYDNDDASYISDNSQYDKNKKKNNNMDYFYEDDDDDEDESYISDPKWYHFKRRLNQIIFVLSLIAIWTSYEFVITLYKAYQHEKATGGLLSWRSNDNNSHLRGT